MEFTQEIERLGPWYHTIDLGDGVATPGRSNVAAKFDQISGQLPADLNGLRVIDLGCNAGGISVEFARRGANVVGVEAGVGYCRQARWVRDRLGLDIEYHNMTVYDIGRLAGTFDVVAFLGLFYHLRYPQLALDLLATKCHGTLIMNTPIVRTGDRVMELRLPENGARTSQAAEPNFNWWFPSPSTLSSMLTTAGFTNIVEFNLSEAPFVSSSKNADNTSAFPTGGIYYRATCRADGSLPAAMLRR